MWLSSSQSLSLFPLGSRLGKFWLFLFATWFASLSLYGNEDTSGETNFYRLRAGDTIQVSVFNEGDLRVDQKIDPDGVIIVPLLGRVQLGGMTLREAETFLESRFIDEDYLIQPQVTIRVSEHAEQVFYVYGEVNRPGSKVFPPGKKSLDILEAITLAGELSQYAKKNEIVLRRRSPETGTEEKMTIDLDALIRGNRRDQKLIEVLPNDTIFVPERLF